jgi:hypothetical protein
VDGISLAKIGAVIGLLRAERYRWQPVKRVYIPKARATCRSLLRRHMPTLDSLVESAVDAFEAAPDHGAAFLVREDVKLAGADHPHDLIRDQFYG